MELMSLQLNVLDICKTGLDGHIAATHEDAFGDHCCEGVVASAAVDCIAGTEAVDLRTVCLDHVGVEHIV